MTICDKIRTVGDTLESNLNARGVSCTFGTGTGEKTILDMVNLITSSNLKGSSDALISISASRPYLLSGEKTDLIVKLVDGLGQPLANKSVSISDGTSVYSGITNNNGLFTLYDVEVSANTTFTATYSTVSATCKVEYCSFVDYAVTNNTNTHWYANNFTRTVDNIGTTIAQTTEGGGNYIPSTATINTNWNLRKSFTVPFEVEFDLLEKGGTVYFRFTDSNGSNYRQATMYTGHYKYILNNQGLTQIFDGESTSLSTTEPTSTMYVGWSISSNSTTDSVKYANFRIREG